MNLVEHAKYELEKAGLFDDDSDYSGMLGTAVLELVEVFSKQGHSGASAFAVVDLLGKLLRYEPLTPITSDPDEWFRVRDELAPHEPNGLWQSKRRPSTFSRDGGRTWYDLDDPTRNNGDVHDRDASKWGPAYLGHNLVPGAIVRVRRDAYQHSFGVEINSVQGRVTAVRHGRVEVAHDNGKAYNHYPDALEVLKLT